VVSLLPVAVVVLIASACGAVAAWALWQLALFVRGANAREKRERSLRLMALFAPGLAAATDDPRALLAWQPLAVTARKLFPEECETLDRACGTTFPFDADHIQAAHAKWTAEWLAWEHRHDIEYKLKAAEIDAAPQTADGSALRRARLDAVEREKLERYQRRYEEYVRIAKAFQSLMK
jgi:hypothetical protein